MSPFFLNLITPFACSLFAGHEIAIHFTTIPSHQYLLYIKLILGDFLISTTSSILDFFLCADDSIQQRVLDEKQ